MWPILVLQCLFTVSLRVGTFPVATGVDVSFRHVKDGWFSSRRPGDKDLSPDIEQFEPAVLPIELSLQVPGAVHQPA